MTNGLAMNGAPKHGYQGMTDDAQDIADIDCTVSI